MFIDTHTHLYVSDFNNDRDQVINSCLENGIIKLLLPNIDFKTIVPMMNLVEKYPGICYPMIGLHPGSVKKDFNKKLNIIKTFIDKYDNIIAIGEIGIDLYWDKSTLEYQKMAFKKQIIWAKEMNLPIVVHARDSFKEIFNIIDNMNDDNLRGIFHCFTGNLEQANRILNYGGFKLGIGGVVTYKNSGLDKTLTKIDLEHLVLETDSPYLSPVPYRGKRNESTYLMHIAEKLADIYQCSINQIAEQTTENACKIFKLKI